jgi:MerR family transcriptional regulator, light-induced transcriptional regulator
VADGVLRIGELSRRTGVSVDLLRAWERRYGLLRPTRTDGGFRLYSGEDLARLRLMQHYLDKGLSAAQAAALVEEAQTAAFDSNPGIPPADVRKALTVLHESLERFEDAPADRVLERLLALFAPGAVLRDVVLPYLRGLGDRWACGEATIAQEHFATGFLEAWMLSMARGWGNPREHRALLACLPGERHVLGLIAFGLALRDLGWQIIYLGPDTPLTAVERAASSVTPDVVVLTATRTAIWDQARDALEDLARRRPLAVGGAGVAGQVAGPRILPADPLVAAHALTAGAAATTIGRTGPDSSAG